MGALKQGLCPLNSEINPVKNSLKMDGRIENLQKWGLGEMPLLGKPAIKCNSAKMLSLEENAQRFPAKYFEASVKQFTKESRNTSTF